MFETNLYTFSNALPAAMLIILKIIYTFFIAFERKSIYVDQSTVEKEMICETFYTPIKELPLPFPCVRKMKLKEKQTKRF